MIPGFSIDDITFSLDEEHWAKKKKLFEVEHIKH